MITNPTKQRQLRGHRASRPHPRAANTSEHQAALAWRLTPRDRWIIRMLHEHRVLTSHQITALAFPSFRSGRMRLRELYLWGVLDRFQPFVSTGTAPMHYVLAPAGATVLAAENGLDTKQLGYRHDRALGIAHSLRLAHTVGVNDWFAALVARASHPQPGERAAVTAWWSETRCAQHFGDLTRPDAYGRWNHHNQRIEFFLEYDTGTEPLGKLAGKLSGYHALAHATGITTPLLVWLPTARRETAARRMLHRAWCDLDTPSTVPVATAAVDLLNQHDSHPSPADAIWLPLDTTHHTGPRRALHHLTDAWPHVPPPHTTNDVSEVRSEMGAGQRVATVPAPNPMPPTTPRTSRIPARR